MRTWAILLIVILSSSLLVSGKKEESLDQLKARAGSAPPDQRISLSLEIAQRQLKLADKLYTDGNPEEARAAIKDVITYSEQAGAAANEFIVSDQDPRQRGGRRLAARARG